MINLYWPTYLNIEVEFNKLLSSIHIDDNQLDVYSGKIGELILRSASEIESISKELYYRNGGVKKGNIHFDFDAIKYLDEKWLLNKKVLVISTINSFQSNKKLYPFIKDFKKEDGSYTFSWNYAYQSLKHNRVKSLQLGSIQNLFGITSALYILNIYYKDQVYKLGKDSQDLNFPINLGSSIFSIRFHDGGSGENFNKGKDIEECIYTSKSTDSTFKILKEACDKQRETQQKLLLKNPKFLKFLSSYDPNSNKELPDAFKILGDEEHRKIFRESFKIANFNSAVEQLKHEAVLNKNQF